MELTHGSLFSGIGGFDLGFERVGFKSVWQVERDPFCQAVLAKRFPEAQRFGDIKEVGRHNLGQVSVITGGFPCQDISIAGKGLGLKGERSGLWTEYARVVSELRPCFVVVENVSALLFRGLGQVLGDLSEIGYDAEWEVIPAQAVGAPHERMRTFIVAYPQSIRYLRQQDEARIFNKSLQESNRCGFTETWGSQTCRGLSGRVFHCPNGGIPGVAHGIPYWVDNRMKAIGNAVVPQITEWLAWNIRKEIEHQQGTQ